ncbi:MAG: TIGR00341 family protein [Aliarcobacter sp.]|nr:TIGR00341 family protein [Aliarcobacter sp.]
MYKNVYFISQEKDKKILDEIFNYIKEKYKSEISTFTLEKIFDDKRDKDILFLLFLGDDEIKTFFQNHLDKQISIAIIPHENSLDTIKNYAISKNINDAIDDAFNPELLSKIDLLKCNDYLAFNRISIGDMHGMNSYDYNENSRFNKIKIFFDHFKNIRFKSYTLTTSEKQTIQTAASGITVLEHLSIATQESAIRDELSIHDGKLNAYILAPTSLISYVWYLLTIFFYQKISLMSLPKSLGFIKASKLTVSSNEMLDYQIDNKDLHQSKTIELEVLQDCINLHLGRDLLEIVKNDDKAIEEKDVIKLNSLPKAELSTILIEGKLPLIKKATDEDFKDLLAVLKDSAKFSYIYATLMILSTLLATTGLFANSTPVIIGAMILAPLMSPIISLSMGVIRADKFLLFQSTRTLILGVILALLFSSIYTLLIPLEQITQEIQGRVNPNLLDLMVAIFSGMAGAYAYSKEEVVKSLAGVAIAVALIPPLSVIGIGIGIGNIDVIYGSFLLFITNLVGITLSAALTFIVLGFAPLKKAKKGLLYTFILMAFISIPLSLSFMKVVDKYDYFNKLNSVKSIVLEDKKVEFKIQTIQNEKNKILINIELISDKHLSFEDYIIIKNKLQETVNKQIVLKITPVIQID